MLDVTDGWKKIWKLIRTEPGTAVLHLQGRLILLNTLFCTKPLVSAPSRTN
jgi:hypothetical protein